jgi:hypothetical protein
MGIGMSVAWANNKFMMWSEPTKMGKSLYLFRDLKYSTILGMKFLMSVFFESLYYRHGSSHDIFKRVALRLCKRCRLGRQLADQPKGFRREWV